MGGAGGDMGGFVVTPEPAPPPTGINAILVEKGRRMVYCVAYKPVQLQSLPHRSRRVTGGMPGVIWVVCPAATWAA